MDGFRSETWGCPVENTLAARLVEFRLPVATEVKLRAKAEALGVPVETYLRTLVERDTAVDARPDALAEAIQRLTSRTPAEIDVDRARILALTEEPRPLPEGKTLADVVVGQWPGDETDEEMRELLEELS